MRGSVAKLVLTAALVLIAGIAVRAPAGAECCIEGCGTVPWTSCTSTNQCTGGVCPGPLGSAISYDPDGICGQGNFSSCPPNEVGQCTDGVNNDAWTGDLLTDCEDPDCAADPACPRLGAPAAGGFGLVATAIALLAMGILVLRSRLRA